MQHVEHQAYIIANTRLEELIDVVTDETPDPLAIELVNVINIIEAYEAIHYPMGIPS